MQKLGDETFPGEHRAIVPKKLFDKVQRLLAANRSNGGAGGRNRYGDLLRGLMRCGSCGAAMTYSITKKNGKAYRYLRCVGAQKRGHDVCATTSVPADKIEAFVVDRIRCIGADPQLQVETFRQAIGQLKAERLGLKREAKRLDRDLIKARKNVKTLVAALTTTEGSSRDAVTVELEKAQKHFRTLENRLGEIRSQQVDIETAQIDEADLARALEAFDPIWDVLLTPEKERVLKLLIERISYDGATEELRIEFQMAGIATLASELESGGSS
jgi:site-specific DNA recombinase